jgi:hypothetical protein
MMLTDPAGRPISDEQGQDRQPIGFNPNKEIKMEEGECMQIRLGMSGPVAGGLEDAFLIYPDVGIEIGSGILIAPIVYWKMSSSQDILWFARDFRAYGVPFSTMLVKQPHWWEKRMKIGKKFVAS